MATDLSGSVLQLCPSKVWHVRLRPFKHPLNYDVFSLRLRMDKPEELARQTNWLFGFNRRRPVSFMNADHGYRDGAGLSVWLADTLRAAGICHPGGAVWLQTFPRMLGYVFNPVSFWYLYDQQAQLKVIVAEVNNTFGQHHQYVLSAPDGGAIQSGQALTCQKVFHVSPFCPVTGHYRFERVISPLNGGKAVDRMTIDYFDDEAIDEPIIRTGIAVQPEPFSTAKLLKAFLRMPFMTFGVIVRIHWHALKLWRGGAKFHQLPDLPNQAVTSNQEPSR
ncbi:MAG: DUF1365 domain-containing protein [Burkholderiaceae bacterium]|nr:DUF1365 domain-containing protein [Burkholderiaceae bacterium]MCD8537476.1 DUF1365 domain-containing protein [Burkholderiaceae bacterium]MCD8565951.1 DUF1365 domain-containing protein [Burkholderiaceae bacterium]